MALIEIGGWAPAMVVLDAMEKMAGVRVLQSELNDRPGVCLKLLGSLGDIQAAAAARRSYRRRHAGRRDRARDPVALAAGQRGLSKLPPISIRFSNKPPYSTRRRI